MNQSTISLSWEARPTKQAMHMVQVAPYMVATAAEGCITAFSFIGEILLEKRK
jgi:hypothetical protein